MMELRWVARRLKRRPLFASMFVAIFGVALGISLVVLNLADATVGTALPYEDPEALVSLAESRPEEGIDRMVSSYASFQDWRDRSNAFEGFGGVRVQVGTTLQMQSGAARLSGAVVSASMFDVLRIEPEMGRAFTEDEDRRGANLTSVVVSHAFWNEFLGADPGRVGASVTLNGVSWTVVGVLPPATTLAPHHDEPVDVWFPLGSAAMIDGPPVYDNRAYRIFQIIGRLRPGVSPVDLANEVRMMTTDLESEHPEAHSGWRWSTTPLRSRVLEGVENPVSSLLWGGVVLFAVAVVNLLALFVQSLRRDMRELTTRRVLGARVGRLVRQGLLELGVLGTLGGLTGLLIGSLGIRLLPRWLAIPLPVHTDVAFDPLVSAGAFTVALAFVLLAGAGAMSIALSRAGASSVIGGRMVGSGRPGRRATAFSVGIQVALTTVLAIGAAVAARSFIALGAMDPGIDPDGLVALRIDVPSEGWTADEVTVVAEDLRRSLEEVPGIDEAHLWAPHVPTAALWYTRVRLMDRPDMADAELPAVRINSVSPGAVAGVGLTLVAGRDLTVDDRTAGRRVVLVSEAAARQWWGSPDEALGRSLRRWNHEEWSEIVGVVRDAPLSGRRGQGSDFFVDVYFPFELDVQRQLVFLTRSSTEQDADALRAVVRAVAPGLPAYDIRSMSDRLAEQDGLARSAALLGAVFAGTAIFLAGLGLYGATMTVVTRRRKEMGLRQALGATPARIASELTVASSRIVLVGLALGVVAAGGALRSLDPTLFVVGPADVPSYVIGIVLVVAASAAALTPPAMRAVRSSPAATLKEVGQ